jgi:hypothetical protein
MGNQRLPGFHDAERVTAYGVKIVWYHKGGLHHLHVTEHGSMIIGRPNRIVRAQAHMITVWMDIQYLVQDTSTCMYMYVLFWA